MDVRATLDFGARYYDPSIDRFISEDPIGLAGGINIFAYAYDEPNDFIDPLGLKPPSPPPPCGDLGIDCAPPPQLPPGQPPCGGSGAGCPPPLPPGPPDPILKYAQCRDVARNQIKKAQVVTTVAGGIGLGDAVIGCLFTGPGIPACEGTVLGLEVVYETVTEVTSHSTEYNDETQCMED